MTGRDPVKLCLECMKHSRNIGMIMTNLGVGRTRLGVIWTCPLCGHKEGKLL